MKRALIAVGAALLLGAATFATSVAMVSSAEARSPGHGGWSGSGGARGWSGGPGRMGMGGPSARFMGPSGKSSFIAGGPGKSHFISGPGKHPHFVRHHRFRGPFFAGPGFYSYGYYDGCTQWDPAYGWVNTCYDYDY